MSFVRRENECIVNERKMFGGEGTVQSLQILNGAEEMYGKGRVFNRVCLNKNCEVAWHIHHGDGECYFILSGHGEYSDNGNVVTVGPGDVTFVGDGEGHSLINREDEPLTAIALILYC